MTDHKQWHTEQELNNFVNIVSTLIGPGSKDRGKTFFGTRNKKAEVVPAGVHQYPFTFPLPENIPPSFSCPHAQIEYVIVVTVEAADKGMSDLVSTARLSVGGSLFDMNFLGNKSTPLQIKESKTFFMVKGSLDVTLSLDSQVFLSGDTIKARLNFVNGSGKHINEITVKLVQKLDVYIGGKVVKNDEYQLASVPLGPLEPKQQKHPTVDLMVPTTAPESVFPKQSLSGKVGRVIQISYEIHIHGDVTLGYDLRMNVPIYIVRRSRNDHLLHSNTTHATAASPSPVPPPAPVAMQSTQDTTYHGVQHYDSSPVGYSSSGTGAVQQPHQQHDAQYDRQWQPQQQQQHESRGSGNQMSAPQQQSAASSTSSASLYPSLATDGTELDFSYQTDIKQNLPPPPRQETRVNLPPPPNVGKQQQAPQYDEFFE